MFYIDDKSVCAIVNIFEKGNLRLCINKYNYF